jgi:hypothetical protein
VDQITHSVELTNEELKEVLNALSFTASEGCDLGKIDIYALMDKFPEPE